jgi:hypothetical protein
MDTKMRAKILTMASAALGLGLMATGCGSKEPQAAEPAQEASGAEATAPAEGEAPAAEGDAPAEGEEGAAEGGGESSCGGASCGGNKTK